MTPQQKRIVCPIINQHGERVGVHHALPEELLYVEAYVDENGTAWTPPTAYAYAMVCESRDRLGEALERVWDAYGFDTSIDSSIWQDVLRALGKALASADTHPKDGDVQQAPLVSGAVGSEASETPNPSHQDTSPSSKDETI
jgi:hypothetical protein